MNIGCLAIALFLLDSRISITTHACPREPYCSPSVQLEIGEAKYTVVLREDAGGASTIGVRYVTVPGTSTTILAVVGTEQGGSDVHIETALIDVSATPPTELIERIESTSQNGLCLGTFAGKPGLLLTEFVWKDESHYAPHFYQATVFEFTEHRFVRRQSRTTRRKHATWRAAARELGYRCTTNLVEEVWGRTAG